MGYELVDAEINGECVLHRGQQSDREYDACAGKSKRPESPAAPPAAKLEQCGAGEDEEDRGIRLHVGETWPNALEHHEIRKPPDQDEGATNENDAAARQRESTPVTRMTFGGGIAWYRRRVRPHALGSVM